VGEESVRGGSDRRGMGDGRKGEERGRRWGDVESKKGAR
jgi:hypothetical protein